METSVNERSIKLEDGTRWESSAEEILPDKPKRL
jgi:hypothetical protein